VRAAIILRWGSKQSGGVVDYPGFLYRQILSTGQMHPERNVSHASGIANLITDTCPAPVRDGSGTDGGGEYG
jgi:hypothetical protein